MKFLLQMNNKPSFSDYKKAKFDKVDKAMFRKVNVLACSSLQRHSLDRFEAYIESGKISLETYFIFLDEFYDIAVLPEGQAANLSGFSNDSYKESYFEKDALAEQKQLMQLAFNLFGSLIFRRGL